MSNKFYILSIDGGGFRGAYSAYLLKRMEDEWGVNWRTQFDLFAGTSTGAIIAAGLAHGESANKLYNLYAEHGQSIFRRRWFARFILGGFSSLIASRYSIKNLRSCLHDVFGDIQLKDIQVPLIIPSVDIGGGRVHVFKSAYDPEFHRDPNVLVADAVMASCSAPTYFDPYVVGHYPLTDGGLWANNPALVAAIEAKRRLGVDLYNLRILSIGAGKSKTCYESTSGRFRNTFLGWGIATRWQREKFINLILNLQAESSYNMLNLFFQTKDKREPDQLLRINFESDNPLSMDDPHKIPNWTREADQDFSHKGHKIKEFLTP